jgi:hypothetical protein
VISRAWDAESWSGLDSGPAQTSSENQQLVLLDAA